MRLRLPRLLLIPVALFPDWLKVLSNWLPFQAIAFVPSSIWLGRPRGACAWLGDDPFELVARGLLAQAGWVAALAFLCALVWRRATRRLTVEGG